MIRDDSIFYRLPHELDRKQALFLDGIRHAIEITDLAYRRLQHTLTKIALDESVTSSRTYAAAYLDAWAMVDAVDRFRALVALVDDARKGNSSERISKSGQLLESVRNLRNVADHLAQRADYVVAHKGSALGSLSWFTITDQASYKGVLCVVVPGTTQPSTHPAPVPAGKEVDFPTGYVHLRAGEYLVDLSGVHRFIREECNLLEDALEAAISRAGLAGSRAGSDLIIKGTITFRPDQCDA